MNVINIIKCFTLVVPTKTNGKSMTSKISGFFKGPWVQFHVSALYLKLDKIR